MYKIRKLHRPFAPKTDKLADLRGEAENINKFKENAATAKKYEEYAAKLLKLSGQVKRACKDLHVLVEKGLKETKDTKKQQYANKINDQIKKLNPILSDWDDLIGEEFYRLGKRYPTFNDVDAQFLGAQQNEDDE